MLSAVVECLHGSRSVTTWPLEILAPVPLTCYQWISNETTILTFDYHGLWVW
jgi:hypothetical protein